MVEKNPFNPSFGRVPRLFLDRSKIVKQLEEDIQDPDSPFLTTLVYGMRGSGKTTLLTDISHNMMKHDDWLVVDLTMGKRFIPTLIESVYAQADNSLRKLTQDKTIGLIICKIDNKYVIEYSSDKRILTREYILS